MFLNVPGLTQSLCHFLGGEGTSTRVRGSHLSSDCGGRTPSLFDENFLPG